jgi:acetyltransferase
LFDPASVAVLHDAAHAAFARRIAEQIRAGGYAGSVELLGNVLAGKRGVLSRKREARPPPAGIDLVLVAVAPENLEAALTAIGAQHARSAVVLPTGVSARSVAEVRDALRGLGMPVLGPNALGLQRPHLKLNSGLTGPLAAPGGLALVSQSGALTAAVLAWASERGVGFSAVVTLGEQAVVELANVFDFLATDPLTESIVVYVEGVINARSFMSALRFAASTKPVIVLKAGRNPEGERAAQSHSDVLVGEDTVFEAALRRAGAVRVGTFAQLISAAQCLAARYRPFGARIALVSNGGGPAVLAADHAARARLRVQPLRAATREALSRALPGENAPDNPIDLGEAARAVEFERALAILLADTEVDGILVLVAPKAATEGEAVAAALSRAASSAGKPLFVTWLGDSRPVRATLAAARIPLFRTPEAAMDAFGNIAQFYRNQQLLRATPQPLVDWRTPRVKSARILIEAALAERRQTLTEGESKALLAAFDVAVTQTVTARSALEAMTIAEQLGYPVVLKVNSADLTHKSDAGGVLLNIRSGEEVRRLYTEMLAEVARAAPAARIDGINVQSMSGKRHGREVAVGVTQDALFGPVITFGAGGTQIELIADHTAELPPLNRFLARQMIERARVFATLGEHRGHPPVDLAALERLLRAISELVCEFPEIAALDVNPVIVDHEGAIAVDARVVLREAPLATRGKYSHLTILPYPGQLTEEVALGEGGYRIRAIRPEDAEPLQAFMRGLSDETRYYRFVQAIRELPQPMLARYTQVDYDRAMALVAESLPSAESGPLAQGALIGVARYVQNPDGDSCEFALVVADAMQGRGIGTRLMKSLIEAARGKGLKRMVGLVLATNERMFRAMTRLGFVTEPAPGDATMRQVVLTL